MRLPMTRWLCLAFAVAALLPGCSGTCRRPGLFSSARFANYPVCPPRPALLPPHPLTPAQTFAVPPPVVRAAPAPPAPQVPEPAPPAERAEWRPGPGPGVRLDVPRPETPEGERAGTPQLPVGIPRFAVVKPRVASGQKPLLDGLDWLRDNGYKTVVHVRAPGEDDSADRTQVEKRGLRYVSLELSPQTLTREAVEQFNFLVTDAASQPLFVYDRDGVLAGALWYLHFRIVDGAADQEAIDKAARLGFRDDGTNNYKLMLLAVQNFLGKEKK